MFSGLMEKLTHSLSHATIYMCYITWNLFQILSRLHLLVSTNANNLKSIKNRQDLHEYAKFFQVNDSFVKVSRLHMLFYLYDILICLD